MTSEEEFALTGDIATALHREINERNARLLADECKHVVAAVLATCAMTAPQRATRDALIAAALERIDEIISQGFGDDVERALHEGLL